MQPSLVISKILNKKLCVFIEIHCNLFSQFIGLAKLLFIVEFFLSINIITQAKKNFINMKMGYNGIHVSTLTHTHCTSIILIQPEPSVLCLHYRHTCDVFSRQSSTAPSHVFCGTLYFGLSK